MNYRQTSRNRISIEFEDLEVETVRTAYIERIFQLMSVGNDSSISDYQKWIANWSGPRQTYNGAGQEPLVDTLQYFRDATDDRVDEILDVDGGLNPDCFGLAGRRYELGLNATHLLISIDLQSTIDSEWRELLDE